MVSPVMQPAELPATSYVRPTSVLMLRNPVPPSQGTDPYHDAFGAFCLPSFPLSALESGSSTPLPPPISMAGLPSSDRSGADLLRNALNASKTGRRRGKWIEDDTSLTTHHLSPEPDDAIASAGADDTSQREFCVTSVTILGHRTLNIDQLGEKLLNGYATESGDKIPYRGAIVTSQRAVEAWAEASYKLGDVIRGGKEPATLWPRVPVFAVGPATSEALRAICKQLVLPLRPALVMGGGATGTGEALASYIVRHFNGPMGAAPGQTLEVEPDEKPLLYLTGDKNASTIADMLSNASPSIPYEPIMVYETSLHSSFSSSCTALSRSLPPLVLSRSGSRRSSRAGSTSSSRRPSVGSLFGTQTGTASPLSSLATEARRSSTSSSDGGGHLGKSALQGAGGPALTAMTPMASTPLSEVENSPVAASSPIEEVDLMLDTDIGLGTGSGTQPDWLVFFSPSGIQYALEDFRNRQWLPQPHTFDADKQEYAKDSVESKQRKEKWLSMGSPEGYPRIAALGPTTKRWIRQNLGFQPDAVAASPGPTELREAIRMAEKRIRRERERLKAEKEDKRRREKENKARLVGVADGGGIPMEMD